jgi:type I restriction enzyme S subunit
VQTLCFAVRRGEVGDSALSVSPQIVSLRQLREDLSNAPWPVCPLGDPDVSVINPRVDIRLIDNSDLVSFVPMEAVEEGMNKVRLVDRPLAEVRKGYTAFEDGDLLWAKITPCMQNGKSAIVHGLTSGTGFGSTEFHVIRAGSKVLNGYLLALLSMPSLLYAAQAAFTGSSGHQRVPALFLESLEIPIPPLDIQHRLVAELDVARAVRDRSLAEAERLLASIDGYTLEQLAILPHPDPRQVFAVQRHQVLQRLDADYHSPQLQRLRRAIENGSYPSRSLSELVVFMRSGFAAGRQDQARGGEPAVPHLRPLNLNSWGELSIAKTKSVPTSSVKPEDYLVRGEVLFNNTNSAVWVGKSGVFDLETPCACSNHMTRIRLKPGIDPYFIAALLNAFRGIGYFSALSTFFNNQAGVNTATLAALRVPAPNEAVQKAIACEVVQRKGEAARLRTRAETVWREARARFEQQLLQGGVA